MFSRTFNWLVFSTVLILSGLFSTNLTAQTPVEQLVEQHQISGTSFETAAPFNTVFTRDKEAIEVAPNAQFLTLDPYFLSKIVIEQPDALTIQLPYHNETLLIDVVRVDLTTPDFSVLDELEQKQPYTLGVHYRGVLRGHGQSVVALSFFDVEMSCVISAAPFGNLVLGKLDNPNNADQYILYSDREMTVKSPFSCQTLDPEGESIQLDHDHDELPESVVNGCVRVYLEADNELYVDKGSSVQNTLNYLLAAWNQVATLYTNEQINITVSQILVWTTPDIYSTANSASVLNEFKSFRTSFNGDLAHLVGLGGNNLGGIAYLDVLCVNGFRYAYSDISTTYQNVPVYSWTIEVMTHEMGHNLGSNHTQWCGWSGGPIDNCFGQEGNCAAGPPPNNGGTIMSYCHLTSAGINFNHGFGPQPGNRIRTEVGSAACLSASCTPAGTCGTPQNISVSNISGSGATIVWDNASGATGYTLRYRAVGAANWTVIANATSPYTISGLPANDEIEVTIQTICGGNSSDANGVIFKTGASGGGGGGGTTCNAPTNLSGTATTSTINASWSAISGALSYGIQWKPTNGGTWTNLINISTTSYNITGLQTNTSYDVQVRTNCTSANSPFSAMTVSTQSGGTACNSPATISPAQTSNSAQITWQQVSGVTTYEISWRQANSSTWGAPELVSANAFTINGLNPATTYNVRVRSVCGTSFSTYIQATFTTLAGPSCNAPTTISPAQTSNSAQITWQQVPGVTTYEISWRQANSSTWGTPELVSANTFTINGLNAVTTYNVRVRSVCGTSFSTYIQATFTTTAGATCNAPASISSTPSTSSAMVSWSFISGVPAYELSWKMSSETNWGAAQTVSTNLFTINNLVPGTTYNIRVRSMCTGVSSGYIEASFTTMGSASCNIPGGLTGTPTSNSINTNWGSVNGAASYSIQWKLATASNWGPLTTVNATNFSITGLLSNTAYHIQVRTNCSNGLTSGFVATYVTTQSNSGGGTCSVPTGLNVSNLTASSGRVTWNAMSGSTSYTLQVKQATSSAWFTFSGLSVTAVTIQNLNPGTAYQVRVRSNCAGGATSAYTAIMTFTTLTNMPAGNAPSVQAPVEGDDIKLNATFTMAPNPVQDRLMIQLLTLDPLQPSEVTFTDAYGRVVSTQKMDDLSDTTELFIADLAPGVYFVSVRTGTNRLATQRLVKL
jgi:hypothetical protein